MSLQPVTLFGDGLDHLPIGIDEMLTEVRNGLGQTFVAATVITPNGFHQRFPADRLSVLFHEDLHDTKEAWFQMYVPTSAAIGQFGPINIHDKPVINNLAHKSDFSSKYTALKRSEDLSKGYLKFFQRREKHFRGHLTSKT